MRNQKFEIRNGFTLVELIIVIAIVSILAAAIFVAIDPARRLHEARNARRQTDVVAMAEALKQYQVDHDGDHFGEVNNATGDVYHILGAQVLMCDTTCSAVAVSNTDCVDLRDIGSDYLATVPQDPKVGTENHTGYYILKDSNGTLTVGACEPEGEGAGGGGVAPKIEVTR